MVLFGNRNKQETLAKTSRYASTPLNAPPGAMYYSNRRRQEADVDLDDLIQQEIQRYEELFEQGNNAYPSPGDDDTLQDGSIYTSIQVSSAMFPPIHRTVSQPGNDDDDKAADESLWGLENPPVTSASKPAAKTSLLKPKEAAAAQACDIKFKQPQPSKATIVPPVPVIPVDQTKEVDVKHATPNPHTNTKRTKCRRSFSMHLFRSNHNNNGTSKKAAARQTVPPTPKTQASTPAPALVPKPNSKRMFFSPPKLLKSNSKSAARQHHPNLLLASFGATAHPKKSTLNNNKNETPVAAPENDVAQQQRSTKHIDSGMKPLTLRKTMSAPPVSYSPPPPIDHCEIRIRDGADGMSVSSAQSSLTDALDAWMVQNTPPKIIGGNHLQDKSPHNFEAYEGGLSPYRTHNNVSSLGDDNDDDEVEEDAIEKEEDASAGSPGALLLTEEGLYFHNNHGKSSSSLSPIRASQQSRHSNDAPDNENHTGHDSLAEMIWADKEQRQLLKETKALIHDDVHPEDADMHVVKILGLQDTEIPDDADGVKRNLFGNDDNDDYGAADTQLDISLAPLQQVVVPDDDEDGEDEEEIKHEEDEEILKKEVVPPCTPQNKSPNQHPKSSKFKRFLSKLVQSSGNHHGQNTKVKQQQETLTKLWIEKERAKAAEAELERQRLDKEETKRIQEKRRRELERQRALELGSYQSQTSGTGHSSGTGTDDDETPPAGTTRTTSLMSGQMRSASETESQTLTTAENAPPLSASTAVLSHLPAAPSIVGDETNKGVPCIPTEKANSCVFCQRLDHPRTHIVIPCMHYVLCDECVEMSREASSECFCPTCDAKGFLYARVGVLEGPELQAKLLQVSGGATQTSSVLNQ